MGRALPAGSTRPDSPLQPLEGGTAACCRKPSRLGPGTDPLPMRTWRMALPRRGPSHPQRPVDPHVTSLCPEFCPCWHLHTQLLDPVLSLVVTAPGHQRGAALPLSLTTPEPLHLSLRYRMLTPSYILCVAQH